MGEAPGRSVLATAGVEVEVEVELELELWPCASGCAGACGDGFNEGEAGVGGWAPGRGGDDEPSRIPTWLRLCPGIEARAGDYNPYP